MAGVIGHVPNPTVAEAVALSAHAEEAGASWIGLADAFWWRDVWMLLTAASQATSRIEIGPAMTNPYMRHRFHTAAALATLQEVAGDRVMCGVAAGGSEITAAAGISRRSAASEVGALVTFLRSVAESRMLDAASGRTLEPTLRPLPFMVAGRGEQMLRVAGEIADRVLLWAVPLSDLERSARVIADAGSSRDVPPQLVWAPLVGHDDAPESSISHVAVYASLNTARGVREGWGLDDHRVEAIRAQLVAGNLSAATALVPGEALDDLVLDGSDRARLAEVASSLGVSSLAVPGFDPETVGGHVRWAAGVEALLG